MKKFLPVILSAMLLFSTFFAGSVSTVSAKELKILEFDTMVGLPQALTGTQNPIRGINGGGLPWVLTSASGELKASGRLEVTVKGLVLAAGPNAGTNPIPAFRAIVSCLGSDGSIQNVMTNTFPATTTGNAKIEATVNLPHPCLAPIVFVTSPTSAWFATTGN